MSLEIKFFFGYNLRPVHLDIRVVETENIRTQPRNCSNFPNKRTSPRKILSCDLTLWKNFLAENQKTYILIHDL